MGAFLIFDVKFKTTKDRKRFEEKYKILKKHILVDENSNCYGFYAWTYERNPLINPIYFMGFLGYDEPRLILKECLREGIKITFLAWNPINDQNSNWTKLKGRWKN